MIECGQNSEYNIEISAVLALTRDRASARYESLRESGESGERDSGGA
jgi:hypothetical protein